MWCVFSKWTLTGNELLRMNLSLSLQECKWWKKWKVNSFRPREMSASAHLPHTAAASTNVMKTNPSDIRLFRPITAVCCCCCCRCWGHNYTHTKINICQGCPAQSFPVSAHLRLKLAWYSKKKTKKNNTLILKWSLQKYQFFVINYGYICGHRYR